MIAETGSLAIRVKSNAFVFSSRGRHTRFDGDWSSDVCSSDLGCLALPDASAVEDVGGVVAGDAVRAGAVVAAQRAVGKAVEPWDRTAADLGAQVHGGRHEDRKSVV